MAKQGRVPVPKTRKTARAATPTLESCEGRCVPTLVFVFNGAGFGAADPNSLTANAASVLRKAGDQVVQLSYPALGTEGVVDGVARQIGAIAHGQPIGLVGFSAGGTLALHLANDPSLHVKAVLDDYGPPDLRDYLALHHGDHFARYVVGHGHFDRGALDALSGPGQADAHVVAAFGLRDRNIVAGPSAASIVRDFPGAKVYNYDGPHGVSIEASPPALEDFLSHI